MFFHVSSRDVRTGHLEMDATAKEERAGAEVVDLATIVALSCLGGDAKLRWKHKQKNLERVRKVSDLSPNIV
jgi:hypothetical protein